MKKKLFYAELSECDTCDEERLVVVSKPISPKGYVIRLCLECTKAATKTIRAEMKAISNHLATERLKNGE